MSTDPKRDERKDIEMNEEELENVAGGDGSVDPTEPIFGQGRPLKPLDPTEAP